MSAIALAPRSTARQALVLLAGNPNSGKSTVFNALSGARTRVANYPGVTIDRRSATVAVSADTSIELTDLPGTYSLAARSREEQIAVESLLGHGPRRPDVILIVADATALARALYLTIEILEIGSPVVIALNMAAALDRLRWHGIETRTIETATQMDVDRFVVQGLTRSEREFQGHQEARLAVSMSAAFGVTLEQAEDQWLALLRQPPG